MIGKMIVSTTNTADTKRRLDFMHFRRRGIDISLAIIPLYVKRKKNVNWLTSLLKVMIAQHATECRVDIR